MQSLHLARHAARIVGTDVNPRALELAALTAALNGADVDLREGSLYEPVAGELFHLIVSNPPFVMSPPRAEADTLAYREGNFSRPTRSSRTSSAAPPTTSRPAAACNC